MAADVDDVDTSIGLWNFGALQDVYKRQIYSCFILIYKTLSALKVTFLMQRGLAKILSLFGTDKELSLIHISEEHVPAKAPMRKSWHSSSLPLPFILPQHAFGTKNSTRG